MEQRALEENKRPNSFDFKRFFIKFLKNYILTVILIVLAVGSVYIYLRSTVPLYQVAAFLQIKTIPDGASILGGSPFSSSNTASSESFTDISGEIYKLQSLPLLNEVVDSLNLDIEISKKTRTKNQPVFLDQLPFMLTTTRALPDEVSELYQLTFNDSGFTIIKENEALMGSFGKPIALNGNSIIINPKDSEKDKQNHRV